MSGAGVDPRLRDHLAAVASSDEEFVAAAFALVLRRPPEDAARERALSSLAEGTLSRATLLHELVTAAESPDGVKRTARRRLGPSYRRLRR